MAQQSGLLASMKRGLKEWDEEGEEKCYQEKPQWKEDWKFCISAHPLHALKPVPQWKEDWKWVSSTIMINGSPYASMKRGLKAFCRHHPFVYWDYPASMKRGLKDPRHSFGSRSKGSSLNEKRIERKWSSILRELWISWASMKRGLKDDRYLS